MLNRVVLIGRLTRDSELSYTPNGVAVCKFSLAVDRNFKNANGERETDFIPVVVYRKLAELCAEYLSKGKIAAIDGRLQVRTYENIEGRKMWVYEVVAENVRFLSPKDGGNSGHGVSSGASDAGTYGHEVSLDDDIPF